MDPSTPRCRRSRPRPITATATPREKLASSSGVRPRSPSTPRTKSSDAFCVSTPSTVHSEVEDDFPFDSSGEWSIGVGDKKNSFQTPKRQPLHHSPLTREKIRHIQKCAPLLSPQQSPEEENNNLRRPRRRMSTRTDNSNETNDSSRRSSPRRRPRRMTSVIKLEEEFLVLSSPAPLATSTTAPETPRRMRRSSSVEPRRRRTASVERRRTGGGGDLPPRRRLSMTKVGSASPQTPEILASPAARRLARHTQSVQQLTREKPPLLRNKSADDLPFDWPDDTPKRPFQ